MFAIYGTSGLMYRGPMEDLRKVAPTLRVAKLRPLDPANDDPASPQTPPAAHEGERRAVQALSACSIPRWTGDPSSGWGM
jgi:hypothetical protein